MHADERARCNHLTLCGGNDLSTKDLGGSFMDAFSHALILAFTPHNSMWGTISCLRHTRYVWGDIGQSLQIAAHYISFLLVLPPAALGSGTHLSYSVYDSLPTCRTRV
jgi:hypothetical protein